MSLHCHRITGCAPVPLVSYLKALGILRLVSGQADPGARGWWRDEAFHLATTLDRQALEDFFTKTYRPTPFLDPWNGGSGFYKSDNSTGLEALLESTAPRFAPYREAIRSAEGLCAGLDVKPTPDQKTRMLQEAARNWRGSLKDWFDAAVVLNAENDPKYPSILGTGGNDGRLDFVNNLMQRIGELFDLASEEGNPTDEALRLLAASLWSSPIPAFKAKAAIGQFHPGWAGGANSTTGADGESLINPWDYCLAMEGAIVLQARVTRRLDPHASSLAGAPFSMYAHAAGFSSPGAENATRGEQWLPLWSSPVTYAELQTLFGEGRLQIGRQTANRPVDAARAVARLGTARGIREFTRYGYLERNGQANLAVPLDRIRVREIGDARLIDDIAPWMDRIQRQARDAHAPQSLRLAERRLADAVFAVLSHDPTPTRWQAVLLAAVALEELQVKGTGFAAGPIPRLRPEWLRVCDDGSAEWRLAVALGSARGCDEKGWIDSVRRHWLPLKGSSQFDTSDQGKRLVHHEWVVMQGRDLVDDGIALVLRRIHEAGEHAQRRLPLEATWGYEAREDDLARFLDGDTDDVRLSGLARALMAMDWRRCKPSSPPARGAAGGKPPAAWWALRLACLPWPASGEHDIPADPAVVLRASAGAGTEAVDIALRRLRAHGLYPPFVAGLADPRLARRWAAALAFPVSRAAARAAVASFMLSSQV